MAGTKSYWKGSKKLSTFSDLAGVMDERFSGIKSPQATGNVQFTPPTTAKPTRPKKVRVVGKTGYPSDG